MTVRTLLAKVPMHKLRVDLTSTTLSTAAWTEILASTPKGCTAMQIAYTGIGILRISKGSAGSEEAGNSRDPNELPFYIFPGMSPDQLIPVEIAAGKRLSCKCLDTNVSVGELVINFYG